MAASNKKEAREKAKEAINGWSLGFASVAWIPGSHYVMAAGDFTLVLQVGSIYGVELDKQQAAQIFTSVAAPLIGSKIAHSILDFIPILGWAIKSGVAFGVTKLVGEALIAHFEDVSPLPE